jgi:aspartate racemase
MARTRTIGIVGGMSPESTATYYQMIVRRHTETCGDHAYPRIVIASVSFQRYVDWLEAGAWGRIRSALGREFAAVAAAGADFAILATNTMHKVLPGLESPIPVLSVFDAVAGAARERGLSRLGLMGTRFTMSDGFYASALAERRIEVVLPDTGEQDDIHRVIFAELIRGVVTTASRRRLAQIAKRLVGRGAEAVLLGCTELQMLEGPSGLGVPTLDTARCHADLAWRVAVGRARMEGYNSRATT